MKKMIYRFLALLCFVALHTTVQAQEKRTVTGTIKDNAGNPLYGATVAEKGTTNSVVSNESGAFTIRVASNATLVISYVGFSPTEVQVNNRSQISVTLTSGSKDLSEVVVTALGIQKQQKSLGYATTTIKAQELTLTAPTNFASALYGKAPGVRIATAPGGSLGGVAIQIRGINSLFGRTQPLIVMDGVPIHDGDFSNNNYWGDQRLRGNGLID